MSEKPLQIAVIGAGVAGLTAAYLLNRRHNVTIFEKNPYAGGHAHTVVIPNGADKGTPVDTGFMLLNDRNYPNFLRLLKQFEVPVRNCHPSFGYWDEKSGFHYAGTGLNGLLAQRSNLWNPSFWLMVREINWFNRKVRKDLTGDRLGNLTLGEYLEEGRYSKSFVQDYLLPFVSAIWLTSSRQIIEFPVGPLAGFMEKQGLLRFGQKPQWQTVEGGSHSYVKAILKTLKNPVRMKETVEEIKRKTSPPGVEGEGKVLIRIKGGQEQAFDKLVMACHADEALGLLVDPSEEEQKLLSPWTYEKNYALLHTDKDVMPPHHRAWASLNYIRERDATMGEPVSMTYHLNPLQGLATQEPYFLSLNRVRPVPDRFIIKDAYYTHPTFTRRALEAQKELPSLNGVNHTYFCGSYFGLGSHEDAVKSALVVAQSLGLDLSSFLLRN